jgi:hypothetical protein
LISRYLSILAALAAGVPVVAHYNSQIKHDYLAMTPFVNWIKIAVDPNQIAAIALTQPRLPPAAVTWARQQTWDKLAKLYQQLWRL